MLKTKVKVGSVTNLSEARYCAGMGVDFLSFPVSSVDPKMFQEITGWVAGPKFGIEVTKNDLETISKYDADFIYVTSDDINIVSDKKLIVSVNVSDWQKEKAKLLAVKDRILFLELTISSFNATAQSAAEEASKEFNVLIKSNSLDDLDQILKLPIAGISLDGSAEVKAGLKEYPLAEILEKLEED